MKKPTLTLVRGLPGSGKSTYAQNNAKDADVFVVSVEADQFHMIDGEYQYNSNVGRHAHQWCLSQTAYYLNKGISVYVANTFINAKEMFPYYELSKDFNIEFNIITMTGIYGSVHNVPTEVIIRMKESWQNFETQELIDIYEKRISIRRDN